VGFYGNYDTESIIGLSPITQPRNCMPANYEEIEAPEEPEDEIEEE
jgi:hypothetical protein